MADSSRFKRVSRNDLVCPLPDKPNALPAAAGLFGTTNNINCRMVLTTEEARPIDSSGQVRTPRPTDTLAELCPYRLSCDNEFAKDSPLPTREKW